MAKPFQVLFDYSDVATLKKFALSNERVRCVMGPFGCIRGDQKIITEEGLVRIADINRPMRVLSWNKKKGRFQLSQSGGSFPKGKDYLYRVATQQGDTVVAGHHRVLCADGKYQQVQNLHCGTDVSLCSPSHSWTKSLINQLSFLSDGLRSLRTHEDWMGCYAESARQYGQQLLMATGNDQVFFQELNDVRQSHDCCDSSLTVGVDGQEEQIQEHTRQYLSFFQKRIGDFFRLSLHRIQGAVDYVSLQPSGYTSGKVQEFLQSLKKLYYHYKGKLFLKCFHSYSSSISNGSILSIDRLNVKEVYWDLQVLDTNNYVTEDGMIHHNSGKSSACVMEIIRRAHQQAPGPDGIRRSRWAVVRNCFDDKTEVLTENRGWKLFKDLAPDDKVGSLVNDKELVFVNPLNYYEYQYDGEMIGYSNRNLDFLVTPEHNLYATMINGRTKEMYGYKFHKAEDVYGMTHYKFKTNADVYNGGKSEFSERMFEFFGFWFAEGYVGKYPRKDTTGHHWRFTVTQKENADYVASLLNDCGFKYGKNKGGSSAFNYSIYVNDDIKALIEKLLPCGKSTTKYLPEWIKNAPRGHLISFLKGYEEGDGHTRTHKNDSTRLYTSSEKLANDLQEVIFKSGGSASLYRRVAKPREGTFKGQGFNFVLTVHQPNQYLPQTQKKNGWKKEMYSGKVYCVEVPSHVIATRRNGIISMSSQSYTQLKDTTIRTFQDWFPPKLFGEYRVTDHMYIITKFPGVHLEVLFRALDRPDQVSNLLSLEVTGAWFNEVREIPKTIIEAMDGRIGRYPSDRDGMASWYGTIMDTNPPDEDSYIYKMFEVIRPEGWKMFKQPSGLSVHAENTKHLPKNYYINLAKGKDEMYKRIYIDGQYGYMVSGKPVFASFKDNIHVAPNVLEPQKGLDVIVGFDFGLQPACSIGQVSPFGQLRILDELVSDGMGLRQFCANQLIPLLRRKYFGMNIMGFGDPSGASRMPTDESTCFEVLSSKEIGLSDIVPAPTNAIMPRIAAVESFLNKMYAGEPGFVLSPNCHFLRKALNGAYHYEKEPKSLGEDYKPMPLKNFASHISDSLQMLCLYIEDRAEHNKRWKLLQGQLKKRPVSRAADSIAGY